MHPELAFDHGRDAVERPSFGGKAGRDGPSVEEPAQAGPGFLIEARGRPEVGARLQAARALLGEGCGPAADAGATYPHMPGDLGLRELSLAQQRRGHQATLLHLLRRQMGRTPNVAFHRAPPHDDVTPPYVTPVA